MRLQIVAVPEGTRIHEQRTEPAGRHNRSPGRKSWVNVIRSEPKSDRTASCEGVDDRVVGAHRAKQS